MTSSSTIRALIVDDDAAARRRLRELAATVPGLSVVGECVNGREAVDSLTSRDIDLVFLDVEMPLLDGFGVIAEVGAGRMPPIIFTSAYSEFGVRAFEAYALDYLLKPFDDARFLAALHRAQVQIETSSQPATARDEVDPRLHGLLEHLQDPRRNSHPDAIAIRTGGQYVVVRVADIDWIEADGNYSKLWVKQRPRLLTKTLATLEKEVLDPDIFVRVHRSAIVNSSKIAAVDPHEHGELTLVLQDGSRVQCSRRFRRRLEERLYFTT